VQTFQEQKDWFESQWPALKAALEAGGPEAAAAAIREHDDPRERRVLFMFVRQGMAGDEWRGKGLDATVAMADLAIAEFLAQAEAETDPERRDARIDGANVVSYNLAADLADCWPGDGPRPERRHCERGLKAADDCLRWREQLGKPAGPFSMAWWARGMHALGLGMTDEAVAAFANSLARAEEAADPAARGLDGAGDFGVVLGHGYLGLARAAAGDPEGAALYERAVGAFTAQLEDEAKKDDAAFGIEQLETVHARYGGAGAEGSGAGA
jgi:hypothetical protein